MLPKQKIGNQSLYFQEHLCTEFPWLTKNSGVGVLCKVCMESSQQIDESKNIFYKKGFNHWNKALEKFRDHEKHKDHKNAVSTILHFNSSQPIDNQINSQLKLNQEKARKVYYIFLKL